MSALRRIHILPFPRKGKFFAGSLAQLVQSVCLTSRGSGVRLPQLPHRRPSEKGRSFCLTVAGSPDSPFHLPPAARTTSRPCAVIRTFPASPRGTGLFPLPSPRGTDNSPPLPCGMRLLPLLSPRGGRLPAILPAILPLLPLLPLFPLFPLFRDICTLSPGSVPGPCSFLAIGPVSPYAKTGRTPAADAPSGPFRTPGRNPSFRPGYFPSSLFPFCGYSGTGISSSSCQPPPSVL